MIGSCAWARSAAQQCCRFLVCRIGTRSTDRPRISMNRFQVIERLRLGRAVSAEVTPPGADHRAFISVVSVVDRLRAELSKSSSGTAEHFPIRRIANEDVICEFKLTYRILKPGWESAPDDWDLFLH